jgi:hypothetical protein
LFSGQRDVLNVQIELASARVETMTKRSRH